MTEIEHKSPLSFNGAGVLDGVYIKPNDYNKACTETYLDSLGNLKCEIISNEQMVESALEYTYEKVPVKDTTYWQSGDKRVMVNPDRYLLKKVCRNTNYGFETTYLRYEFYP